MSWFLTLISIVGTILNIRQDRRGFYFWGVANIGWILVDTNVKQYAQAFLFASYLVLAIWGLISWRHKPAPNE